MLDTHPDSTPEFRAGPSAVQVSGYLRERLSTFLAPLLQTLDQKIDARLVRTFRDALEAILSFRHRNMGLLLSELGAYILSPEHAPAGTKRLSNLLRCDKWSASLLLDFLWRGAHERVKVLEGEGKTPLLLWDDSVNEKHESFHAQGLCPVRSSKAKRLTKIKPGYYHPPGKPIFVPGFHWLSLLVIGTSGPPTVAGMEWRTTRETKDGPPPERAATVRLRWLKQCAQAWERRVLHVWDRGYAGSEWLKAAMEQKVRFVVRWPKANHLVGLTPEGGPDGKGKRPAWQISRGKRSMDHRHLRDTRRNELRRVGIVFFRVAHPRQSAQRDPLPEGDLWLVVARSGVPGQEPWYLLTNEPVKTAEDAWRVVLAYARRWQIEMSFRYNKSELAMESPRLWAWERRIKLLLMVTLAYAFLLSLLDETLELLREWLLRHYCHRTGKRGRETPAPLYRLRAALSRLWLDFPSNYRSVAINSG
jgi:hypothetical protein